MIENMLASIIKIPTDKLLNDNDVLYADLNQYFFYSIQVSVDIVLSAHLSVV